YELQMIGENCFVTAVEPESEAEKAGLQVGMKLLAIDTMMIGSMHFWEISYISRILRPQATDELKVQGLDQMSKTIGVSPKVTPIPRHVFLSDARGESFHHAQTLRKKLSPRWHSFGETVIVWKVQTFMADEKQMDDLLDRSEKYKALVLDL